MDPSTTPIRPVQLGPSNVSLEQRADGSMILRNLDPLQPHPRRLTERLVKWATETPDRVFIAERPADGQGWTTLTYADAYARARSVGQALLDRGLSLDRPVMILAENSINHAILALACYHTGIPYVPVNPAYATLGGDYARLRHHVDLCQPQLVFTDDGRRVEAAASAVFPDVELVVTRDPPASRPATLFAELVATPATDAVERAFAAVTPDTIGKIMFTSGTVGSPKGVIYDQRLLCANRQQNLQQMPFMAEHPFVLVEWLPWHHTFGGTCNFGNILCFGGSLYIEPGRPIPGQVEKSVAALTEIAPTMYNATPSGLAALFPFMRSDAAFRRSFFSRLKLVHYGGAAMSEHVRGEFNRIAIEELGERIFICSGIGSTETGPVATGLVTENTVPHAVGLPMAGSEVKLAPVEDGRYELRNRGPNVSRGYYNDDERTRAAFDEEGFFRTGDAVRMIDVKRPELGMVYDGRLGENFKLSVGTWVNVAEIRQQILAVCAPCLQEVVIAGESRDFVSALLFPDWAQLQRAIGATEEGADRATHPAVLEFFRSALGQLPSGSITKGIRRAIVEPVPLSLDLGELTAKMSVSANRVLANRTASIARLYADEPDPAVIRLGA